MRLSICGLKTEQSEYAIYVFVTSVYVFVHFFMILSKTET